MRDNRTRTREPIAPRKVLQTVYTAVTNGRLFPFTFFAGLHFRKRTIAIPMIVKHRFNFIATLLGTMLIAGSLSATQSDANVGSTFTGEIMDSLCAKDGSHDKMMQEMKSMGHDKKDCSAKCIQLGAKYVLYDSSKQAIYELDDQDKAGEFAGHKVRVSGTLEKKKIKVSNIVAAD
jgi:hypothetical protein